MSKKRNEFKRSMQAWGVNQLRETTGQNNKEQLDVGQEQQK